MKFLHTLLLLLFALNIQATENTIDIAQNLAKKHCQNPSLKKTGIKQSSLLRSSSDEPSYFIFSDDASRDFCIISADGETVLGYGSNYTNELPTTLQAALDTYAATPQRLPELRSETTRENIPAFMDVVFGTRSPYNIYIPRREGSGPPVGCVPVSLAQICKYYNYPPKLLDDIPGYAHRSSVTPDTIYQIEGQKAEGRTYNWSLILNHYEKDTTEELNLEIAKLMSDCARSVETKFEQSGSSAISEMIYYSAAHYFGFNSDSMKCLTRTLFYREEWLDIIHKELSKKRPIYVSASSYHHGGHAFICDGYEDGYLHINWGWNGAFDGYFDVDILDYKRNYTKEQSTPDNGYSFFESIIIGIVPGEGKKEIKRPQSSSSIIHSREDGLTADSRFRATDNGLMLYLSVDAYKNDAKEDKYFALGYADENGDILFAENCKSTRFSSNNLILEIGKEFDKSYLGKEIQLYILESDKNTAEALAKDTLYKWWHISDSFEPITIRVPDSIENNDSIIKPEAVEFLGEHSNSSIALNIGFKADKPEGCMKYFTLAIVVDGDTLMSENESDFNDSPEDYIYINKTFKKPNLEKEMTLIVMQSDNFTQDATLKKNEWSVCNNFEPIPFKLADCTIFSTDIKIDNIVHTTKGKKHRFEVTFSNPSQYEFYNDVYFLVEEYATGFMLDVPAGGTTKRIIEHEMPELTQYIQTLFYVVNNNKAAAKLTFAKDTFSHVFYNLNAGDETTITLEIYNGKNTTYENTLVLLNGTDTLANQPVSVESSADIQYKFNLPVITSNTDTLALNYAEYSIYGDDDTNLGSVVPLDYYGKITQSLVDGEMFISIDLKPTADNKMPTLLIGVTSSMDDPDSYEKLKYTPSFSEQKISIDFKLSDYCSIEKPKYIGLLKEDETFYAYMELSWGDNNSSSDIISNDLSVVAVDGGVWISSYIDIPSLPIHNANGKLMRKVVANAESALFVPLARGFYIVGDKKILVP